MIKVDHIIKNAKFFTSDQDTPNATALAVKDGKFVMPSIVDSHVHVSMGVVFEYSYHGQRRYRFLLERQKLNDEFLTKENLNLVCSENEFVILESEGHSIPANSKVLAAYGFTDETPDKGLSFQKHSEVYFGGKKIN